jgi:hypothetical protein
VNLDESDEYTDAVGLTETALSHARAGSWRQTGADVQAMHDRYGGEGLQVLLLGLADAIVVHQGGPGVPGELVMPVWVDSTGAVGNANDVRPAVRWAGRFIAARAVDDGAACAALVNSCTSDAEFFQNVCAMLEVAVMTLNVVVGSCR